MPNGSWRRSTIKFTPYAGAVWRILAKEHAHLPLAPARADEGRFHYDGQIAIYTSLTAEGAGTAVQRYLAEDRRPKVIVPLLVEATDILDMRGTPEDVQATTKVWQDIRANGLRAPTWDLSDKARASGAQGMLYRSRTHPGLSHLVLFGVPDPGSLSAMAKAKDWP